MVWYCTLWCGMECGCDLICCSVVWCDVVIYDITRGDVM